jgi:drug/metabolite transporter (DMT)-like permease
LIIYDLLIRVSETFYKLFQVSFQLKIFTTAIFTVLLLRRQFNLVQWLALFLLFLGISLVQIENITSTKPKQDVNAVFGLISVVTACKFYYQNLSFQKKTKF